MARDTRILMGMPITVEVVCDAAEGIVDAVFDHFAAVDARFSPFQQESEVSALNAARIAPSELSADLIEILDIAALSKHETQGYFDIRRPDGRFDPSGIVKGWSISRAAKQIAAAGFQDFCVDAGGDIQTGGRPTQDDNWRIGIRNPFAETQIVKVVILRNRGIATSGTYVRGQHVYDPHRPGAPVEDLVSLTVVASDVLDADRFATAAFAMGRAGIDFIEATPGLEGYAIDPQGIATQTSGFGKFVAQ
jgi:thiamine biosynthesis lipoprotein